MTREIASAALSALLPVALTLHGYGPSTANALIGAVACSLLLAILGGRDARMRVAVAATAGVVGGARFDPSIGVALTSGLLLADWVVRGRPISRGLGPPVRAALPVALLLAIALVRMDSGWAAFGPGPMIIVLLGCTGIVAQLARVSGASVAWPLTLVVVSLPLAWQGFEFDPAAAIAMPLLSALLVAMLLASTDMPPAWPERLTGSAPYLLLFPGAVWWMWNVSSWWAGSLVYQEIGFAAWDAYTSELPRSVLSAKATLAFPAWLISVLVIGSAVVLHGRRALLWAATTMVGLGLWAVVLATFWVGSIDSPFLP